MCKILPLFVCSLLSSCWWSLDPSARTFPEPPTPVPPPPITPEIPDAVKVPGREGYVLSPYDNKVVNCQGLKSGTLVYDPYDTRKPQRKFRVP